MQSKGALGVLFTMLEHAISELQHQQVQLQKVSAAVTDADTLADDSPTGAGAAGALGAPDGQHIGSEAGDESGDPVAPAAAVESPLTELRQLQQLYNHQYCVMMSVLHLIRVICTNAGLARVIVTKTQVPPTLLAIMAHAWHETPQPPGSHLLFARPPSPRQSVNNSASFAKTPEPVVGTPSPSTIGVAPCSTAPVMLAARVLSGVIAQLDEETISVEILTDKALVPTLLAALYACQHERFSPMAWQQPASRRGTAEQVRLSTPAPGNESPAATSPVRRRSLLFSSNKASSPAAAGSPPGASHSNSNSPPPFEPRNWLYSTEWQVLECTSDVSCQQAVLGLFSQLASNRQLHLAVYKNALCKDLVTQLVVEANAAVEALQSGPDADALLRLSCSLATLNAFGASSSRASGILSSKPQMLDEMHQALLAAESSCKKQINAQISISAQTEAKSGVQV